MCWLKWLGELRILPSVNLEELPKVLKVYILTIFREFCSDYCANVMTKSFYGPEYNLACAWLVCLLLFTF